MSNEGKHILGQFDEALSRLREDVLQMSVIAVQNLRNAIEGLIKRDLPLCNEAIAGDEEVNQLEVEVDREATEIIAKYSPMASNLRKVIATMKMAQNLERVSDQAKNIGKRGRKMIKGDPLEETSLIEPVHHKAIDLIDASVRAFSEGDTQSALKIKERDKDLDRAYKNLVKLLNQRLEETSEGSRNYVHLMFVARSLERIGDYAVNIAEEAIYAETAFDIRHGGDRPD